MAISRVFTLLFTVFNFSHSLHEDQVDLMDWHQQYIGKVKQAVFQTQKAGRKRVIVATEENVVASLHLRRDEIFWRKVLGAKDAVDEIAWRSENVCNVRLITFKIIRGKDWFIAGADDKMIRVYNYCTTEKVKEFEAHTDYIRSVDVHSSLPYVLSASDDKLIKLWDWEKGLECTQVFEGHDHF
ncbi:hypothetical protein POM88_003325 [Heracleum sosnowskyi]|uniref:EMC1 first beta-propeller domain-containing protein n=1 Tax=Heracleum sosnowskyi TaxID=360622 RepID=A0AAD8JKG7_9APIA|nr:hypothetical protein POM88_003325 [Heracleum sosnowskyi]